MRRLRIADLVATSTISSKPHGRPESALRTPLTEHQFDKTHQESHTPYSTPCPGHRAVYYACTMPTTPQTCQWCGVELPPQEGRGRKRKFCSPSCKQRAYEQRASVSGTAIPAEAVILAPERADDLRDQLVQLRCAAEDIAIAHREGADHTEIAELCEELVNMAKRVERLR